MNDTTERQKMKLEWLNQRLADLDAERGRLQKEKQAVKSSIKKDTPSGLWSSATIAAGGVLILSFLASNGVFRDAQSSVTANDSLGLSPLSALQKEQTVSDQRPLSTSESLSGTGKTKTRSARKRAATQRQWGPLLVMPEQEASKRYYGFDPVVKKQQQNLLTLGFDLGEADGFKGQRTRQSLAEFRALYMPDSAKSLRDAELAPTIEAYADLARSDAARYGIDHGIVAAIRLSSVRTGVDFAYLMKLAATESNFEPESRAATSSATGLYQFTHDTWLNAIKTHGVKYGLVADYSAKIEHYRTRSGYQRPFLRDKATYEHLLSLRKNPRMAAMMAAETVLENQQKLEHSLDRELTETDLYLTHFLGTDAAITFLKSLEQSPATHAVELFPEAARSNHSIFHPETCAPRTVDEVYTLFGEKLSRRTYEQQDSLQPNVRTQDLRSGQSSAALKQPSTPYQWEQGRAL